MSSLFKFQFSRDPFLKELEGLSTHGEAWEDEIVTYVMHISGFAR